MSTYNVNKNCYYCSASTDTYANVDIIETSDTSGTVQQRVHRVCYEKMLPEGFVQGSVNGKASLIQTFPSSTGVSLVRRESNSHIINRDSASFSIPEPRSNGMFPFGGSSNSSHDSLKRMHNNISDESGSSLQNNGQSQRLRMGEDADEEGEGDALFSNKADSLEALRRLMALQPGDVVVNSEHNYWKSQLGIPTFITNCPREGTADSHYYGWLPRPTSRQRSAFSFSQIPAVNSQHNTEGYFSSNPHSFSAANRLREQRVYNISELQLNFQGAYMRATLEFDSNNNLQNNSNNQQ